VGLSGALGPGNVALDTAIFIDLIEENPRSLPVILPLFEDADQGKRQLVTSALTLFEMIVVPLRAGNRLLARQYETLLMRSRGVRVIPISHELLAAAAQLRAVTDVSTPDALQLAAAISGGCASFLTSHRQLPAVSGLRILDLASYIPPDTNAS
jgi:predicted nucleic acid-binding protein